MYLRFLWKARAFTKFNFYLSFFFCLIFFPFVFLIFSLFREAYSDIILFRTNLTIKGSLALLCSILTIFIAL
ncbi:hypothetical protein F4806DRAFT_452301 [Annulohypoxylon nitens]|nr:hypothetical protein F4806DRAFT_452301 [Annulohypoxylon nitens]